ncbi:F-box protein pof6 [Fusarium oxysporum f. sp. albedinis]|nr:F-box protein pof6 [Fusarium oxysporum f. sp. albedinis]
MGNSRTTTGRAKQAVDPSLAPDLGPFSILMNIGTDINILTIITQVRDKARVQEFTWVHGIQVRYRALAAVLEKLEHQFVLPGSIVPWHGECRGIVAPRLNLNDSLHEERKVLCCARHLTKGWLNALPSLRRKFCLF